MHLEEVCHNDALDAEKNIPGLQLLVCWAAWDYAFNN